MAYTNFTDSQFMNALSNRNDLDIFAENKVSIFALELFFGLDDVLYPFNLKIQVSISENYP